MIAGGNSIPLVSLFLQRYMHLVLGPFLIVMGMFLLQLIQISAASRGMSGALQRRVESLGVWGAFC